MKTLEIQRSSTINAPQEAHGYELHPAKFGVIEWLQSVRKNPVITSEKEPELRDIAELCWAFTKPSATITSMTSKQADSEIRAFMDNLDADAFHAIQKHAERELLRFTQTKAVPKKKERPQAKKPNRKA